MELVVLVEIVMLGLVWGLVWVERQGFDLSLAAAVAMMAMLLKAVAAVLARRLIMAAVAEVVVRQMELVERAARLKLVTVAQVEVGLLAQVRQWLVMQLLN